jgi:hypothetical protein
VTRIGAVLPLVLILAACTSQSGTQIPEADGYVETGDPFSIRVGQTAGVFTSQGVVDLVRFSGVAQDSRCPADVQCVQPGSATVLLSVQSSLDAQDVSVDVPPGGQAEVAVNELMVTVLNLSPEARQGVTINPLEYVARLVVDETESLPPPN